jgi:MFS family permease
MLATLNDELGIKILRGSARDAHLLLLQRFVRLLAYGQSTLVLTGYLSVLGFSDFQMGLFMTFTLVGDVAGSSLLTLYADRVGRRKVLLAGSALMAFSGLVFASTGNYALLLLAAIVGVISPRYVPQRSSHRCVD